MKIQSIIILLGLTILTACGSKEKKAATVKEDKVTVAAYYFPNYHTDDPRNAAFKGEGWAEWELVKAATPRFPGEHQPNVRDPQGQDHLS